MDLPAAACRDGVDPLHQKFSVKAQLALCLVIHVVALVAIYRDKKFITPTITQVCLVALLYQDHLFYPLNLNCSLLENES